VLRSLGKQFKHRLPIACGYKVSCRLSRWHCSSPNTPAATMNAEPEIKRNPHPDFKSVEGSRPHWDAERQWTVTQTIRPDWKLGDGPNDGGACLEIPHVEIDPYEAGRPAVDNYKLMISGVIPRPIGFVSTRSKDGSSTNLAPFSYTQMINHDPPLFIVGFAGA
jgi:hypothetical protein